MIEARVSYVCESVLAEQEHGLESLDPKHLRLHQLDGAAVHFDEPTSTLAVCDGDCLFLRDEGGGGVSAAEDRCFVGDHYLAAEDLHRLNLVKLHLCAVAESAAISKLCLYLESWWPPARERTRGMVFFSF